VGGVEDLVRCPSCAGGVCDGGDQGWPGGVGEDAGCGSLAEELRKDGGPFGSQRFGAGVVSAGDGGGGEVRGQAPPQRGGRLFVGKRAVVCDAAREGGDVDTGAFGRAEPVGEGGPVGVGGDPGVDAVGELSPPADVGAWVAADCADALVETALGALVGDSRASGAGWSTVVIRDGGGRAPDSDLGQQVVVGVAGCVE
jgi:hypothetical protein